MNKKEWNIFFKRNIYRYTVNKLCGIHRIKKLKCNKFLEKMIEYKLIIEYFFFKRIYIPQIEFTITTNCTLKCKDCINYIPLISKKEQINVSFQEFKNNLYNILRPIARLQSLILIGGEPLLNRNLCNMLQYSLKQKKIENIYIITNGTISFSSELINILKNNNNKVTVWISNYTTNEELVKIIKSKDIIKKLKYNKIKYIFQKDLFWFKTSPIKFKNRTKEQNIDYFEKCLNPCVSILDQKMFVCPRAGIFHLKKIINSGNKEFLDLSKKINKNDIINFYSNNDFSACNFCSSLNDCKYHVKPAIQL
ncbi:MAG TPA: 4Fe-4S cluster-binding domain-containing protein [Rickettsiales bacterium]|nr:4Fe-4S cluster-binding domain-containing protein [Rickettsiales bacterium]